MECCGQQELETLTRTASESKMASQLSSAISLAGADSAEWTQMTDPEVVHKMVKKIRAMYGSCSTGDSTDVVHMLGSIQVSRQSLQRKLNFDPKGIWPEGKTGAKYGTDKAEETGFGATWTASVKPDA